MLPGARSTLRLSDPYHFQVSVTRPHATQLPPQPTADINCDCRTLQVVCFMTWSRPRAWHLHRGARAHTLHIRNRCAYVARDAHRGHQPFRHIYLTPHTRTRLRLCVPWRAGVALGLHGAMGVREAARLWQGGHAGTKMMVYFAVTLDPCTPCHLRAARAIWLQSRAFSRRVSRLDQRR